MEAVREEGSNPFTSLACHLLQTFYLLFIPFDKVNICLSWETYDWVDLRGAFLLPTNCSFLPFLPPMIQ